MALRKTDASYTPATEAELVQFFGFNDAVGYGLTCFYKVGEHSTGSVRVLHATSLTAHDVDARTYGKAKQIELRPLKARQRLLTHVEQARRYGFKMNEREVEFVLDLLGAGERTVKAALATPADPLTIKRRAEQQAAKERAIELAAAEVAIKQNIELKGEFARIERQAAREQAGNLPLAGSKARMIYDAMVRDGGCTLAELREMTGYPRSFDQDGHAFAKKTGLVFTKTKDGKVVRYTLTPAA